MHCPSPPDNAVLFDVMVYRFTSQRIVLIDVLFDIIIYLS